MRRAASPPVEAGLRPALSLAAPRAALFRLPEGENMSKKTRAARLTEYAAWKALEAHYRKVKALPLRKLFADDPRRGERMTAEAVGIYFDYSKNLITDETLALLLKLAEESDLRGRIDAMFRGDAINVTEKRAVLHVALRAPRGRSIITGGEDVVPSVLSPGGD